MTPAMRVVRAGTALLLVLALGGVTAVVAGRAVHMSVAPVLSGSMRPTFAPGDLIVMRSVAVRDLRVGQVPVFVPPGQSAAYAHRVVSLTGDAAHPVLRTKGDANPTPDGWVSQLNAPTVPVVVGHLPALGRLLVVGRTPHTRALLILLVGLTATAAAVRLVLGTPPPPRSALPWEHRMSLIPSSSRSRLALAGGVAVAGLALTSAGVYASLQASATNAAAPQSVTSGVLSLTMTPGSGSVGFSQGIANMAPGDTVNRYVDLTNGATIGTAGLTLAASDSAASILSTSATTGLQVAVTSCSVAWTVATGTCSGTTSALTAGSLAALTAAPATLLSGTVPSLQHLQVSLSLPNSTEVTVNGTPPANSVQGASSSLTWTFTETQAVGTTTNS